MRHRDDGPSESRACPCSISFWLWTSSLLAGRSNGACPVWPGGRCSLLWHPSVEPSGGCGSRQAFPRRVRGTPRCSCSPSSGCIHGNKGEDSTLCRFLPWSGGRHGRAPFFPPLHRSRRTCVRTSHTGTAWPHSLGVRLSGIRFLKSPDSASAVCRTPRIRTRWTTMGGATCSVPPMSWSSAHGGPVMEEANLRALSCCRSVVPCTRSSCFSGLF